MRTFVYQKESSCHKRRRMMRRFVYQNYRRCRKRERRMKRFANQTEPLPANKKRIEANKLSPKANTFSRGKVMVNLSHSKYHIRKVIPKRNRCWPQKFHGNKAKLAPEKIASAGTQMLLRLRRSVGLC